MPLTQLTVTGGANGWVYPDGTQASGTVTLQPLQEVSGGGYNVVNAPKTFTVLNGAIQPPNQIANNSQVPILQYLVTEQITGAQNPPPYVVSPTGSTLDLSIAARGSGPVTPLYVPVGAVGTANGVCPLDGTAHVPSQYLPAGSGVLSVTAGDSTITIGGTAANPTVAVNAIAESKVTNLTSDLATINTSLAAKATKEIVRRARVTSGDTTLPNTGASWAAVSGFELDIPAVVGDDVEIGFSAMRNANANALLDIAVITTSGGLVRFMASGTSTPALEGDPAWYTQSTFIGHSADRGFTVTSNDLDGSNVRFVLACKSNGSGTVYSSTNYPFYWRAINRGAVS